MIIKINIFTLQQYNEGAECIHKVYGGLMDLQLINEMVSVLKNFSGLDENDKVNYIRPLLLYILALLT